MICFIQSCSIDTTAYFSILIIIIKVHKNNFQTISLSHVVHASCDGIKDLQIVLGFVKCFWILEMF